ncbi:MAG: bifunctional lysylphosphatidylglycerol flippase/synthetase MprF [Planctomycetia bacterium]|nr:bifunctional lysylphosphatidylglycerol flippase/synthetase MprF [Planctomycetia bacterium]
MTSGGRRGAAGSWHWKSRLLGLVGPLLVLCVFAAAIYVLHRELHAYHLRDIENSLARIGWLQVAAAVALTATSFTLLTGYDWLAVHFIERSLPYVQVALASFVSYVCSYNFGALLGGTTMRYRLYSTFGLSPVEIVKIVAICTLTFVLGFCTLAGSLFVLDPLPLPELILNSPLFNYIPATTVFPIGIALLAAVVVYLAASFVWHRPIVWRGFEIALPSVRFTLMQVAIATADLMAAGGVLYAVLPAEISTPYATFLGIWLMAQVAGILSHVPGGLGVVEAVLLVMLAPEDRAALLGSIILYRLIYYLMPLGVAAVLLAAHEGFQQRAIVTRFAGMFGRWVPAIVPRVLALTTFAGGAMLVVTGALPRHVGRWHYLATAVPLPAVELSHFLASVTGMALLLLARGLQQRLDAAYHFTVALLAGGIVLSLLRAFDVEEAAILLLMLVSLLPCRQYFDRRASLAGETLTSGWLTSIVLVLVAAVWLGAFSHKHVEYSGALWWQFALAEDAPRFLRATVGAAAVLLMVGLWRLLRPVGPETGLPDAADLDAAARIVAQSPRASAHLALVGDKSLLFNADRTAFVMFAVEGSSWVTMGDPVGPESEAKELAWRFRELCDRHAGWPVFYQVAAESLPLYLDLGLMPLKLGEEAHVPLADFSLEGSNRRSLRQAHHHAVQAGCAFEVAPAGTIDALLPELREISDEWLRTRDAREKCFSLGYFSADYLRRCPIALVRVEGRIVAFSNLWPSGAKHELSGDLMRYRHGGPSGVMDFLFIETMLWGRAQGFGRFNLGMAPLSGLDAGPLAPLWHRLGTLVFRHGEHFYNFQGLRHYKEKFAPRWEPKYLASPGGLWTPRILANVATLIGGTAAQSRPTNAA